VLAGGRLRRQGRVVDVDASVAEPLASVAVPSVADPSTKATTPSGVPEPLVSEAVATVLPVDSLRWISFGHVESDECGAMNLWLAAAPAAQVVHGMTACMVSLNDLADRPPRALFDEEVLDLGGKRVRYLDTPHVPHAWESGLMFEETTRTLFTGDLFTQLGDQGPVLDAGGIVEAAIVAEEAFQATSLTPLLGPTLRRLKALAPTCLAVMHGPCYVGDCEGELERLAAENAALKEQALRYAADAEMRVKIPM
jgi:flavorubredoxin